MVSEIIFSKVVHCNVRISSHTSVDWCLFLVPFSGLFFKSTLRTKVEHVSLFRCNCQEILATLKIAKMKMPLFLVGQLGSVWIQLNCCIKISHEGEGPVSQSESNAHSDLLSSCLCSCPLLINDDGDGGRSQGRWMFVWSADSIGLKRGVRICWLGLWWCSLGEEGRGINRLVRQTGSRQPRN